jgi:HAD superfamily hydrolase (TIGR01509 family)
MTVTPILHLSGKRIECDLVIFDMTGTLIDTQARLRARARSRAQVLAGLVGEEAVINWAKLSGVSIGTWDTDEDGPLAKAPRREDLIVAASAIYLAGRRWEEARKLARKAYDEADRKLAASYEPALFEGVEETLRMLKASGMRLAIATNDRRADAEETMRTIGVLDLFDAVVGADEVEHPKPSPDMILLACERCERQPSTAVCVGDQPTDMEAGRAAGVRAVVGIRQSPDPSPELSSSADFVLESVRSLQAV